MSNHWNAAGDMVIEDRTVFRPIGWLINGGINDGVIIKKITEDYQSVPHGSFTPVYIEIGD